MRAHLKNALQKMDYLRVITLVMMIGMIAVSLVRAAIPVELQDLHDASLKQDVNANKYVGGFNTCDKTGKCQHPFAVTSTVLAHLLGGATGVTETSSQAYRLGPPLPNEEYLSYTPGALGTTTEYMALALGKPMISSTEYIADVMQNLHVPGVDRAYAQGLGFSSLSPILGLWKLFRNLAYFFFVVVFLVVGMMIMFRSQIGSQAAVTVQQALPKMIVSLLLVTFSYAIAGLMIDVMYLLIYLAIAVFQNNEGGLTVQVLTEIAFRKSFISNVIGGNSLMNTPGNATGAVGTIAGALGDIVVGALNLGDIAGTIVQGGTNLIFTVVIAFALLVSVFRVFFSLVQAYIGIFFSVIFAPIILLIGALPGQNTFSTWLKGLVENLLVFPVLIVLIFIGFYFTNVSFSKNKVDSLGFSPPQLGSNQTNGGFEVYSALIPFAAILSMPDVLKIAKGILQGKLDVNIADTMKRVKAGAQVGIPVTGAGLGAVYGMGQGVVGGWKKGDRWDIIRNAWRGYNDGSGNYTGGIKQGIGLGVQKSRRPAKMLDNALEGRFFDPSDTANLLEALRENKDSEKAAAAQKARQEKEDKVIPV